MTTEERQLHNDKLSEQGGIARAYAQHMINTALAVGVPESALAEVCSHPLTELPATLSTTDYLALFTVAVRFQPAIGLEVGRRVTPGAYPTLGLTLLSCETLDQTLEQVILFESLIHDLGTTQLNRKENTIELIWQPNDMYFPDPTSATYRCVVESVFAGIQAFAEWLTGQPLLPISVQVAYPKPGYHSWEALTQCQVSFNGDTNKVVANSCVLERVITAGDSSMYQVVRAHAEQLKASQSKQGLAKQVKRFLVTHLSAKDVAIEGAAQACNVSVRTLQRKLKDAGTGYQALLDETRHELALHYLTTTQLTMDQIADAIGFQETTSFFHAFKLWQGVTPNEYRSDIQLD
ncbi:MAG: AraC family transcriptional regulator [Pseudomonadales bacterium]|nr:AraC family transcriptional regulator [Pseudomonadales bacterium]